MYKWAEALQDLGGGSVVVELAQNGWAATATIFTDDEDVIIHGGCPYGESQLRTIMERLGERLEVYLKTGEVVTE
jgi:ribulose 1,5-bisphosphate carboxylase large subunit-like protein